MEREQDTRELLIAAAERLFGERGIDAVSLRQVNTAAGQRNASASHYHFGSKQALIETILERRLASVNERRCQRIEDALRDGRGGEIRMVVEAFIYPIAEEVQKPGGSHYVRFLAQVYGDPTVRIREAIRGKHDEGVTRAIELGMKILADRPPEIAAQRLFLAAGHAIYALADRERLLAAGDDPGGLLEATYFVSNLIDLITGALEAPVSEGTLRQLERVAAKHKG